MVLFEELLRRNEQYANGEGIVQLSDLKKAREETVNAQHPEITMITCSDSRVSPELIFLAKPGEIFTIRTAGNVVVGDDVMATVEYAIKHLHTKEIVVLGHSNCGAVTAAVKNVKEEGYLNELMEKIKPAVQDARRILERKNESYTDDMLLELSIKKNVMNVIGDLISRMPILDELINKNEIKIIPAYYDLSTGKVTIIE